MPHDEPNEPLDADEILRTLKRFGVEFVVIGGVAAVMLGATVGTLDVDVVPEPSDENLDRLATALLDMDAEVTGAGRVRDFGDGAWLRASNVWNFTTRLGRLDVILAPAGLDGFPELAAAATAADAGGGTIMTASIEHLIAMKEAANRPKDQLSLPILRWLRDRDTTTDPEPS